ncbi:MAG: hypothetical protein Q9160_006504 [Pyrenula sp. 1 TL-2023]
MLVAALAVALLQIDIGFALPTISAVGAKLFTSEGQQWFIKGVAYQLSNDDPLVNVDQCKKDVTVMKDLGVNAIRVYHVDPKQDHKGCMSALEDAGIYLFVDLDTFPTYILADQPEWDKSRLEAYQAVLDEFQKYDNTAGVFVGNEVLNEPSDIKAAPYVLAAGRDIKQYRDQKGYRNIPVGYSAADIATLRPMLQNYMACRPEPRERLDFYALNSYEWCGPASYTTSGYSILQNMTADLNIPIFFSETGCNAVKPRTFGDQEAIFSPDMSDTWSGSIIYEYVQEANDFGLVSYGPPTAPVAASNGLETCAHNDSSWSADEVSFYRYSNNPEPIQPDYDNLKSQWAKVSPKGVSQSAYDTATVKPVACPPQDATWTIDPSAALPTLGSTETFTPNSVTPTTASGTSSATGTAKPTSEPSGSSAENNAAQASDKPHKSDGAGHSMLNFLRRSKGTSGEGCELSATGTALVAIGLAFFWL